MIKTPLCDLLGIEYPIFQGGMAWISDGKLAAAVSNGGGLGIISAMNADAEYLKKQIDLARSLTDKPFGVNIMLMSPFAEEVAKLTAEEKVAVVPGTAFGDSGEGFLRISYAYSLEELKRALARIENFIKRLDGKA